MQYELSTQELVRNWKKMVLNKMLNITMIHRFDMSILKMGFLGNILNQVNCYYIRTCQILTL